MKPAAKPEAPGAAVKPDFKSVTALDHKSESSTAAMGAKPITLPAPAVSPKTEPTTTGAQKEEEKLGAKIRRKGDILNALRAGGTLVFTSEGLYRITKSDASQHRVSKRRAASFVAQGLVKLTKTDSVGKHYIFDPEAEKADAKKTESKPEPKAESGATPKIGGPLASV
jgi:hypothetical protein